MHFRSKLGTLIVLAGLWASSSARPADVSFVPELHALFLRGAIAETDVETLRASYRGASEKPSAIYLNSSGGDFYAAITAGNWVREMGLETYAGLLCESACAYLWLGGVRRYANYSIGIHAPYVRTSFLTVDVPAEGLMDAAWYLAKLGYDRPLIDAIFAVGTTNSNECFPITGPETRYLGIGYERFVEAPFKAALDSLRSSP
jgi:hypothetical protein